MARSIYLSVDLFVHLFVCFLKCVLVRNWPNSPSSTIVMVAVSVQSAAGPVHDILMAVDAYHVGHAGCTSSSRMRDIRCIVSRY